MDNVRIHEPNEVIAHFKTTRKPGFARINLLFGDSFWLVLVLDDLVDTVPVDIYFAVTIVEIYENRIASQHFEIVRYLVCPMQSVVYHVVS